MSTEYTARLSTAIVFIVLGVVYIREGYAWEQWVATGIIALVIWTLLEKYWPASKDVPLIPANFPYIIKHTDWTREHLQRLYSTIEYRDGLTMTIPVKRRLFK